MTPPLQLVVRTPGSVVVETGADSIRVLTETGHVGLRPRMESVILPIEPGLMLVYLEDSCLFVATAGGLIKCNGKEAVLLTPLAVAAQDQQAVMRDMQRQLSEPKAELEVRNAINAIQSSILHEITEDRRLRQRSPEVGP